MRIGATHTASQFRHELSHVDYVQLHLSHTDNVRKNARKTAPLVAACSRRSVLARAHNRTFAEHDSVISRSDEFEHRSCGVRRVPRCE
jgi:hypothetical protein